LLPFECDLAGLDGDVFLLDLALTRPGVAGAVRNRYIFSRAVDLSPLLNVPPTRLDVRLKSGTGQDTLAITNTGRVVALFVWAEPDRPVNAPGGAFFGANYFCLLPGEGRAVPVEWHGVPPAERRLRVAGWNTDTHQVGP
jgi:hypothetical protein